MHFNYIAVTKSLNTTPLMNMPAEEHEIAYRLEDPEKIAYSGILLNFTLLSSGLFKETGRDSLQAIHTGQCMTVSRQILCIKQDIFTTWLIMPMMLLILPSKYAGTVIPGYGIGMYSPTSFLSLLQWIEDIRTGNMQGAHANLKKIITVEIIGNIELALTTSTLSDIYIQTVIPTQPFIAGSCCHCKIYSHQQRETSAILTGTNII